jgi:hypothetical protein
MRLILDTNILLSVLLSPLGGSAKLLDAWERKVFTLVACEALTLNSATSPARHSSVRDFAPVRPNCSPLAFVTSLFFAGTCPPARSRRTPKTVTCSRWLKQAKPSFS